MKKAVVAAAAGALVLTCASAAFAQNSSLGSVLKSTAQTAAENLSIS